MIGQKAPETRRIRAVFTVKQFAGELGISTRTVWRLIEKQKIKSVPISIGRTGIPGSELERIQAGGLVR